MDCKVISEYKVKPKEFERYLRPYKEGAQFEVQDCNPSSNIKRYQIYIVHKNVPAIISAVLYNPNTNTQITIYPVRDIGVKAPTYIDTLDSKEYAAFIKKVEEEYFIFSKEN